METVNNQGLEFTDGPVVKTFQYRGRFNPWPGTRSYMLRLRVLMQQPIPGTVKYTHK